MISPAYEYSKSRLWLAYGVAIAISAVIIVAGLTVMSMGSAAYNNNFSNILRLARGAHLSHEVANEDHDGKEPLPKHLQKATISFADTALWRQHASNDPEYKLVPVEASEHAALHDGHDTYAEPGAQPSHQSRNEAHVANVGVQNRSDVSSQAASLNRESHPSSVSVGKAVSSFVGNGDFVPSTRPGSHDTKPAIATPLPLPVDSRT